MPPDTRKAIYLAGPLGFSAPGRMYHELVVETTRKAGLDPIDPWVVDSDLQALLDLPEDDPHRAQQLPEANRRVGAQNAAGIRRADGVLAVLDGCDVDSGTAAEIGYAAALGKPVVGLRTDTRVSGDNEATIVNLQVEWFIHASQGRITSDLDDAISAMVDLTADA